MPLWPCAPGRAEADIGTLLTQAEYDGLRTLAAEKAFDFRETLEQLIRGEVGGADQLARQLFDRLKAQLNATLSEALLRLMTPVAVCVALKMLLNGNPAAMGMSNLLCALCCALTLGGYAAEGRQIAESLLSDMNRLSEALVPFMVSVAALTGAPVTASILTPLASECAGIIDWGLKAYGLNVCVAASTVAIAGGLSNRFRLTRLFELLKGAVRWLMLVSLFCFGGMMSVRGLISASGDSAVSQAARTALEKLVPVIGGELSGSVGSALASGQALRRAVGFTGAALILHTCVNPLMKLGATLLTLKLSAAAVEPLGDDMTAIRMMGQFAEVMELFMALCACAAMVTLLLTGGCVLLFDNIQG